MSAELDQLHANQHAMRSEIERLTYELSRSNETIRRFHAVFEKLTKEGHDVNQELQNHDLQLALQAATAMLSQRDQQIIQLQVTMNKMQEHINATDPRGKAEEQEAVSAPKPGKDSGVPKAVEKKKS